jgi:hypothetical protein
VVVVDWSDLLPRLVLLLEGQVVVVVVEVWAA